jgi:hypothetical protein
MLASSLTKELGIKLPVVAIDHVYAFATAFATLLIALIATNTSLKVGGKKIN